jgi:hypothetical protein
MRYAHGDMGWIHRSRIGSDRGPKDVLGLCVTLHPLVRRRFKASMRNFFLR